MQALIAILVIALVGAGLVVVARDIYRAYQGTPDSRNVPGREMRAVGVAVVAFLDNADKADPIREKLTFLKLKLLNRGLVAPLSAQEMRLAYIAVRFQKSSLLGKLSDRHAYAAPNTIQDYKESLYYIRMFELKFREGVYTSSDITEA